MPTTKQVAFNYHPLEDLQMETRYYTEKSNARRAAKAAGIDPDSVFETDEGFTFRPKPEETITDESWPRHDDGRRKKIGEMTHQQQVAVARGVVEQLKPQFAEQGVKLEFGGVLPHAADPLDIPAALKLTPEQRREGWEKNPPKAQPIKAKEISMPKTKAKSAKEKKTSGTEKTEALLKMLAGKGATVESLCEKTGWLPHTLRARLSGLQKNKKDGGMGLKIERERVDGVTTYRIAA